MVGGAEMVGGFDAIWVCYKCDLCRNDILVVIGTIGLCSQEGSVMLLRMNTKLIRDQFVCPAGG